MWCIGQITGEYLARLEDVLHLYSLPYNKARPVLCYDEMPVQLLGEVVTPLPMKEAAALRFDYEYRRNGVANILLAVEPLTGKRVVARLAAKNQSRLCPLQRTSCRKVSRSRSDYFD